MRRFVVLFDSLPIDRASVKSGTNSSEVITACRCINVGLFLSGNLRRDVTVSITTGPIDDLKIVSFPGHALKRVSPDERSISFFLLKSFDIAKDLVQDSRRVLNNGIVVEKEGLRQLVGSYAPDSVFLAYRESTSNLDSSYRLQDALLVYDTGTCIDMTDSRVTGMKYRTLPCSAHPERFILDINEKSDSDESDS